MDDNEKAAHILSHVIHQDVLMAKRREILGLDLDIAVEDIGVWIDPIGKVIKTSG